MKTKFTQFFMLAIFLFLVLTGCQSDHNEMNITYEDLSFLPDLTIDEEKNYITTTAEHHGYVHTFKGYTDDFKSVGFIHSYISYTNLQALESEQKSYDKRIQDTISENAYIDVDIEPSSILTHYACSRVGYHYFDCVLYAQRDNNISYVDIVLPYKSDHEVSQILNTLNDLVVQSFEFATD